MFGSINNLDYICSVIIKQLETMRLIKRQPRQIKPITNEKLLEILKLEKESYPGVYTDRRNTAEEMLRMRGVSF